MTKNPAPNSWLLTGPAPNCWRFWGNITTWPNLFHKWIITWYLTDFLLDDPSSVVLDLKGPEFTWVNSSMFKTTGQDAKCEEFSSNNDVQDSNFHTVPNSHFLSKNSIILFVYIFSCLFTFSAVYLHFQLFIYIINCLLTLDKKWNFVTVCSSLSIWRSKNSWKNKDFCAKSADKKVNKQLKM